MSILPISGSLGGNDVTQGQFKAKIEEQRQFIEDSIGTDSSDLRFYNKTEIDSTVVKNNGDETIGGIKTFSSSPIAPTPSEGDNSTKVATTEFVLANSGGGGGGVPIAMSRQVKGSYEIVGTDLVLTDGLLSISNGYNTKGADNILIELTGTVVPTNGWE